MATDPVSIGATDGVLRADFVFRTFVHQDPKDPTSLATYYITFQGQTPKAFDMNFKQPNVAVKQGTIEDWMVDNRAREAHVFHIHQLHFQVMERNGKPFGDLSLRDTIDLPFWDGKGAYPSVKLRMDFRSPDIAGTFVYHCHILEHADGGMMVVIPVANRVVNRVTNRVGKPL